MKNTGAVLALTLWTVLTVAAQQTTLPDTTATPLTPAVALPAPWDSTAALVAPTAAPSLPTEQRRSHIPPDLLYQRISDSLVTALHSAAGQTLGSRLQRVLDLSPEQRQALTLLQRDMQQELDWIYTQVADLSMAPVTARQRFQAAAALQRERLGQILTPEQYALLQRARTHLIRRPRQQIHPSAQLQIARRLQLSRRQTAQWYEILRQQRRILWEMLQAGGEPSRQALRQLREEHRRALEELLAPPQRQQLAAMRLSWQAKRQAADTADAE